MHALTTYYHVPPNPPASVPMLHLDGTGGPVANSIVLTDAAPGYAPGRPGAGGLDRARRGRPVPEAVVRARAGPASTPCRPTTGRTCTPPRSAHALPAFRPGRPVRSPVELGDGIFVAGDHRDTPSTQGALVSGRRAAQAVARRPRRVA